MIGGITETIVALSNAEKQKRWRDRRNRLAKQAEIAGLIKALARAATGLTNPEIMEIGREVQLRLREVRERAKEA
jgi:hypothetical protein